MKPQRIQLSRKAGFNLKETSYWMNRLPVVNVARPGKYGNPWKIGSRYYDYGLCKTMRIQCATQAVEQFRLWLKCAPITRRAWVVELRGKNLACWCKLGEPCHADVLLEIANA